MSRERIQKILAQAGVASRRAGETLLTAGRVRVNGSIVRELGSKADPARDRIEVDGKRVVLEKPVYYLVHKPREMVTTLDDPEGRRALGDLLRRIPQRVFPVGRLDYHTTGALLVTNDGEMAQALMHPRREVPKTYVAKLKGSVDEAQLQALTNGVVLDDGAKTRPAKVSVLREERGNSWLQITLTEGRNRQIHRMARAVDKRVMRLHRIAFAGLSVEGMPPETLRPLHAKEVDRLKRDYLNPRKRQQRNERRGQSPSELDLAQHTEPSRPQSGGKPGKPSGRRKPPRKPGERRATRRKSSAAEPAAGKAKAAAKRAPKHVAKSKNAGTEGHPKPAATKTSRDASGAATRRDTQARAGSRASYGKRNNRG